MPSDIRPCLGHHLRHHQPVAVHGAPADALDGTILCLPCQQPERPRSPVRVSYRPHAYLQRLGHGGVAHLVLAVEDSSVDEEQDAGMQVGDVLEVALLSEPLTPQECLLVSHLSPFSEGRQQTQFHVAREGLQSGSDYAEIWLASSDLRVACGFAPAAARHFSRSLHYSNRHTATDRRV